MEKYKYIKKEINKYFNIKIENETRQREYVEARMIYYWICYYFTNMNLTQIARTLGKNHATILHSIRNFPDFIETDKEFKQKFLGVYDLIKKKLKKEPHQMSIEELTFRYNELLMENGKLKETIKKLQN